MTLAAPTFFAPPLPAATCGIFGLRHGADKAYPVADPTAVHGNRQRHDPQKVLRMNQFNTFNGILVSLHQAMLDDAHWPATSALIDEACGTKGSALLVGEGTGNDVRVVFMAGYFRGERREDLEQDYLENYHPWDERVPRFRKLADSRVVRMSELYTEQELKTSRTYNEFLPRASSQNGLGVRLVAPDGSHTTWAILDPVTRGGWGSAQIETVHRLLPHIRHFVQVRQALAAAAARDTTLDSLLDSTRIGVIHLDRRGRIIEANTPAHRLLRQGDGLFDREGFLHARKAANDAHLQTLVGRASSAFVGDTATSGSMTVSRSPGRPRLAVHVCPVPVRQMDFGVCRPATLVLLVDPASRPRISAQRLEHCLGLSSSEARVSALLAEGRSVRDIAVQAGFQESYVRWLLKQVYKKHGLSGQIPLVKMVLAADLLPPH